MTLTLTLAYVSGALFVGFVFGWASMCVAFDPMITRLRADAARWRYVRNNAEIVGTYQEGVFTWEFELPDIDQDSIDADVDAAILAARSRIR